MRLRNLLLISLFAFALTNCSKDTPVTPTIETEEKPDPTPQEPNEPEESEEPAEPKLETYFTFVAGSNVVSEPSTGDWIILHKANGELLDYKRINNNETLTFQALDTVDVDEITVSLFTPLETEFNKNYRINTYGKIEKGRTWKHDRENITSPTPTGEFDLVVSNIPNWLEFSLYSDGGYGRSLPSYFHLLSTGGTDPDELVIENFSLYEDNNYLLTIIGEDRNPKYTWINNIKNNEQINIDGAVELQDFEQNVDITMPAGATSFLYATSAIDAINEIKIPMYYVFSPSDITGINNIRLGYLDSYEKYTSSVNFSFENYSYNYAQTGNALTASAINPIEPVVNFSDVSLANYEIDTSTEHISYSSYWQATSNDGNISNSTVWTTTADKGFYPKITEMPEEFSDLYPSLQVDDLELLNISLFLKTDTWENHIGNLFGDVETTTETPIKESVTVRPN